MSDVEPAAEPDPGADPKPVSAAPAPASPATSRAPIEPAAPVGPAPSAPDREDLALSMRLGQALARELTIHLGEQTIPSLLRQWQAFRNWDQRQPATGGLRESKKRITRQQISDVATALFIARGFDNVTIAEIAATVGVSEKTVYNYFPTKESLVFDHADEQLQRLASAVRERDRSTSPATALARALVEDERLFELPGGTEDRALVAAFGQMVDSTPALRAAWSEHQRRLEAEISAVLAAEFDVDPHAPEPSIMGQALSGLLVVFRESVQRHLDEGATGPELNGLVQTDLARAGRLLETGFWALPLMVSGARTRRQVQDAAAIAEQSRKQVIAAVQDAKANWREIREQLKREFKDNARQDRERARQQAQHQREQARQQAQHERERARQQAQHEREQARQQAQHEREQERQQAQHDRARGERNAKRQS